MVLCPVLVGNGEEPNPMERKVVVVRVVGPVVKWRRLIPGCLLLFLFFFFICQWRACQGACMSKEGGG